MRLLPNLLELSLNPTSRPLSPDPQAITREPGADRGLVTLLLASFQALLRTGSRGEEQRDERSSQVPPGLPVCG